uniref:Cadherin domain-containing protein n=1 Tax=Panagrolaimus sp. PS1159 TaxID=55785 RepID=A0AC35EZ92_9BILA
NYKIKVYANSKDYTVSADVNIDVLDENDNAPQFEKQHYIFNVTEEREAAFYVKAIDPDEDANSEIKYILVEPIPENVTLNEKTGRISVKKIDVDSIGKSEINFIVMAEDSGEPPLNSTAQVTLKLMDINDNAPFFSKRAY